MYKLTIEGKDLNELKTAVADLNSSLNGEFTVNTTAPVESIKLTEEETEAIYGDSEVEEVKPFEMPVVPVIATAPVVIDGLELDGEGISWDERIHTSAKTKTVKGIWKNKRGVDKALVAQVKAEQLGNVTSPAPVATVTEVAPVEVATPIVPAMPTLPAMNNGHTVETFTANFPMVIAGLIQENKIGQDWINSLNAHFGVTEIHTISDEQKAGVFDVLVQQNLITKVG